MVEGKFAIDDNFVVEPSPRRPLSRASSGGGGGLFTGDIAHHRVQIAAPHVGRVVRSGPRLRIRAGA